MRRPAFLATLVIATLALAQPAPQQTAPQLRGQLVLEHLHSAALEKNLFGDSAEREFYVYLPPSYARSSRRYPAIYFLGGYTDEYRRAGERLAPQAERAFASGSGEAIFVFLDGINRLGGSFYTDSVATGDWERYITREVVAFVDAKYRTMASSASRGISGHSMGGNGALRLAIRHPEIYGAVYGMSACCMTWVDDFSTDNPNWNKVLDITTIDQFRNNFLFGQGAPPNSVEQVREGVITRAWIAAAAAWSPDPEHAPFYGQLPVRRDGGKLIALPEVVAQWSVNMPVAMADTNRDNLRRLRGIALDVGRQDEFPHIVTGARLFARALKRNGIACQFEEYEGTHGDQVVDRFGSKVVPFFARTLAFDASR